MARRVDPFIDLAFTLADFARASATHRRGEPSEWQRASEGARQRARPAADYLGQGWQRGSLAEAAHRVTRGQPVRCAFVDVAGTVELVECRTFAELDRLISRLLDMTDRGRVVSFRWEVRAA